MKKATKRKSTLGGATRCKLGLGTNSWRCDFCLEAEFPSYDAATEHEQSCPSRSLVEIPYKPDKKLGLIPINAIDKSMPKKKYYVTLSKSSPVFKLANNTRAASKALFGLDPWEMKNDTEAIECMAAFGRANLPEINKVNCKGAPVDAGAINSEVMKSALIGQLRPGDRIKSIDYKEGSKIVERITQCLENKPEGAQDLCYLLKHER